MALERTVPGRAVLARVSGPYGAGRALLRPLGVYAVSRVLVLAFMQLAGRLSAAPASLNDVAKRWDGGWYLDTAKLGYPADLTSVNGRLTQSRHVFFPLYPWTSRALDPVLPEGLVFASVLVATVGGAAAAVLLWRVAARLRELRAPGSVEDVAGFADRAVLLFCLFPGSFVLSWVYSEGVLLPLLLATVLALLYGRLWWAAGFAAFATASRPNAVPIVLAVAWVAFEQWRGDRRRWWTLLAPVVSLGGFLGFHLFLWRRTGEPLAWFRVERDAWHEGRPGVRTWEIVRSVKDVRYFANVATLVFVVLAVGLVALVFTSRLLPWWARWMSLAIVVLAVTANIAPASMRLQFPAVPVFVALAERVRAPLSLALVSTVSCLGLAVLVLAYGTVGYRPFNMWAP